MLGLMKDLAGLLNQQSLNTLTYRPLSGSSYINLPVELGSSKKGLINIKNKDQKCFLWCYIRYINPSKEHPERITKKTKNLLSIFLIQKKLHKKIKSLLVILIMLQLSFPCKKKILVRLRRKAIFALMCLFKKMS